MLHLGPPIAEAEAAKYAAIWSDSAYAETSPGAAFADLFMEISGAQQGESVLDFGCGAGAGALALKERGLVPELLDLVDGGLTPEARSLPFIRQSAWAPLGGRWDHVYCCDVLEHLPTELTLLAARNAIAGARKGTFFSIGLTEDAMGALIGEVLHLTVRPFAWWRDRLAELGRLTEARDLISTGVYYVAP